MSKLFAKPSTVIGTGARACTENDRSKQFAPPQIQRLQLLPGWKTRDAI